VTGDRKVMRALGKRPFWAMFDLAADPLENTPLDPGPAERRVLLAWEKAARAVKLPFEPVPNPMGLDQRGKFIKGRPRPAEEDLERLRSLGYL
jgi:hypothetical protein